MPELSHLLFTTAHERGKTAVGETLALPYPQHCFIQRLHVVFAHALFARDEILYLRQEPRIDAAAVMNFRQGHAQAERVGHVPQAFGAGILQFVTQPGHGFAVVLRDFFTQTVDAGFQAAQGLVQRLLEIAADGHDLADGLHLRGQPVIGLGEFLEREARHFRHDVIDRRFERNRNHAAGDFVAQFIQRIADGKFGRNFRDREPGRLRRQCRRA